MMDGSRGVGASGGKARPPFDLWSVHAMDKKAEIRGSLRGPDVEGLTRRSEESPGVRSSRVLDAINAILSVI